MARTGRLEARRCQRPRPVRLLTMFCVTYNRMRLSDHSHLLSGGAGCEASIGKEIQQIVELCAILRDLWFRRNDLRRQSFIAAWLAFIGILLVPYCIWAQVPPLNGVGGIVVDASGAAVVRAKVVLRAGSLHETQFTSSRGEFTFSNVSNEAVDLEVSAAGFANRTLTWHSGEGALRV